MSTVKKYYSVTVKTFNESTQENGKTKIITKNEYYLIFCEGIPQAEAIASLICKGTYDDYVIRSVKETNYITVINGD